jgi:type I restriction enzyme S subunit
MSWRKYYIGELVESVSIRAKDIVHNNNLKFLGVSNENGITISKYAAEDKAEDYKIIEKGCFAYNPYRINVGSIALMNDEGMGLISPAYVVFKPKPNSIIPELLLSFLKSNEGLRQIKLNARGTVRQALRFEDLCKIEISLPSYDEQEVLYKKLKLFEEQGNKQISELTHQLTLLKNLRQQILQDAVQGKLVPQNPNDEPASKLLERIKDALLQAQGTKKIKELPPIKPDEIPFDIPESWVWCRMQDLCIELLGGYAFDSTRYVKNSNHQVVRLGNVKTNKIVLETSPVYIDNKYALEATKSKLQIGDILITMTGTRAKKDYLFSLCLTGSDFDNKNLYLNQRIGCFRFGEFVSKFFINYVIKDIRLLNPVFETSTGAANQANIGIIALKNINIPLPPLPEQHRIVAKIDKLMKLCDDLEQSIRQNQQYTQELLQVALREALEGGDEE